MNSILNFIISIIAFAGYVYNIIWMFKNWGGMDTLWRVVHVISIFIAPLGAVLGIYHYFMNRSRSY